MSDQAQDQAPEPKIEVKRSHDPAASLRNRIAAMMAEPDAGDAPQPSDAQQSGFTNDGDGNVPALTIPVVTAGTTPPVPPASTAPAGSTSTASAGQPPAPQDSKDFRVLKEALDRRDAKISELEQELNAIKPNAEKVTQLEQELEQAQVEVRETRQWREKHDLLRSDEFQNTIAVPRQTIFNTIKAELEADGIDPAIWGQAQLATSRKDLEAIVNNNIESELLKGQFYTLFFQDLELRQKEARALEAPARYMQQVRDEEVAARNQRVELQRSSFNTTWEAALNDATQMAMKLGENKLVETMFIDGNTEHNEKVVKPILEAAHQGARAALEERLAAGLPVDRGIAANIVYLWRQAIAAQAANQDRLRWYHESRRLTAEVEQLRQQLGKRAVIDNPMPSSRGPGRPPKASGATITDRISSLAQEMGAKPLE